MVYEEEFHDLISRASDMAMLTQTVCRLVPLDMDVREEMTWTPREEKRLIRVLARRFAISPQTLAKAKVTDEEPRVFRRHKDKNGMVIAAVMFNGHRIFTLGDSANQC